MCRISKIISVIIVIHLFSSCKKFIDIDAPSTEIVAETVFSNDATAGAAVKGIYSSMMTGQTLTNGYLELYTGLSADELINYSTINAVQEFYNNSLLPSNPIIFNVFWKEPYRYINNANGIIEGLDKSLHISPLVKKQLKGEALFIRALNHFYLVNLFGKIPYIKTTNYRLNSITERMTVEQVYDQIVADLLIAKDLLDDEYISSPGEKNQPNKATAMALLARCYLYMGKWQDAIDQATEIINNSQYDLENDLDNVFLVNSTEAIWQLTPVVPGVNSNQALLFVLSLTPSSSFGKVALSENLVAAFEAGDLRKDKWVNVFSNTNGSWFYSNKYKVVSSTNVTESNMMFRLAEQYLIRAEAYAEMSNVTASQSDINAIRNRAGLGNTTASNKPELLTAIEAERRFELFTECGNRWFDLKRTDRANAILSPIKPDWQNNDMLYPIPQSELLLNPNFTQNPGY